MIVVADTSVILNLCCVGQQELLPALFREVFIPPEVRQLDSTWRNGPAPYTAAALVMEETRNMGDKFLGSKFRHALATKNLTQDINFKLIEHWSNQGAATLRLVDGTRYAANSTQERPLTSVWRRPASIFMRLAFAISFIYITSIGATYAAKTLTFDDLSPGSSGVVIRNGYEGLMWNNFGVFNGSTRPLSEGYRTGMVSPTNVVFNGSGDPASIACGNPFDLNSAYVTGGFGDFQIRVQGLIGTNVAYDNTYAISNEGPALINFNYLGIDKVKFVPPFAWFVLDNLVVTVTNYPAVNFQNIQASTLGHALWDLSCPGSPPPPEPNVVNDYLIDQDHTTGGGGVLQSVSANFDTNNQFALTISAPVGKKFLVHPPAAQPVRFWGSLLWRYDDGPFGAPGEAGTTAVSFGGLEGTPPDFSASHSDLATYHCLFGFGEIQSTAFTNDLAFRSVTFTGTWIPQYTNSGTLNYFPHDANELRLSYTTYETNDPGPFVSIVPAGPSVDLHLEANGDLTIAFTGTLQSASDVQGPYNDVPGNPQGTFRIPKANLASQQFFRAKGN